jgi:hypothetical protein
MFLGLSRVILAEFVSCIPVMTLSKEETCSCQNFCSELLSNLIEEIDPEERTAKQKRFTLYKIAAHYLGFKNCNPLPGCIVKKIKDAWPEKDDVYTGYKEAE